MLCIQKKAASRTFRLNVLHHRGEVAGRDGAPGGDTNEASTASPKDWLLNAADDRTRFELLQRYLRGFDQPMREVGERYTSMFHALERENFELATYHWGSRHPAPPENAESWYT